VKVLAPIHAYLIDRLAAEEGTIPYLIRETVAFNECDTRISFKASYAVF